MVVRDGLGVCIWIIYMEVLCLYNGGCVGVVVESVEFYLFYILLFLYCHYILCCWRRSWSADLYMNL